MNTTIDEKTKEEILHLINNYIDAVVDFERHDKESIKLHRAKTESLKTAGQILSSLIKNISPNYYDGIDFDYMIMSIFRYRNEISDLVLTRGFEVFISVNHPNIINEKAKVLFACIPYAIVDVHTEHPNYNWKIFLRSGRKMTVDDCYKGRY
jgi:hypothetical protein